MQDLTERLNSRAQGASVSPTDPQLQARVTLMEEELAATKRQLQEERASAQGTFSVLRSEHEQVVEQLRLRTESAKANMADSNAVLQQTRQQLADSNCTLAEAQQAWHEQVLTLQASLQAATQQAEGGAEALVALQQTLELQQRRASDAEKAREDAALQLEELQQSLTSGKAAGAADMELELEQTRARVQALSKQVCICVRPCIND